MAFRRTLFRRHCSNHYLMTLLLAIRQHEIVVVIKYANHHLSKRQGDQRKQKMGPNNSTRIIGRCHASQRSDLWPDAASHREKATILSRVLVDSLSFQSIAFWQILFIGVLILTNDLPWRSQIQNVLLWCTRREQALIAHLLRKRSQSFCQPCWWYASLFSGFHQCLWSPHRDEGNNSFARGRRINITFARSSKSSRNMQVEQRRVVSEHPHKHVTCCKINITRFKVAVPQNIPESYSTYYNTKQLKWSSATRARATLVIERVIFSEGFTATLPGLPPPSSFSIAVRCPIDPSQTLLYSRVISLLYYQSQTPHCS